MTQFAFDPELVTVMDEDDEEEENVGMRKAPAGESKTGDDRQNPPTEYDVLELDNLSADALKTKLNELGAEGWALVAASPYFIFRRGKKDEEKKPRARVGFGV